MKFTVYRGLPYISITVRHNNRNFLFERVLIDTGSAASIFSSDALANIDVKPEDNDKLHRIQGVGGYEYVVEKTIDAIVCGDHIAVDFPIQIGEVDYGQGIQAIIGSDLLNRMNAVINYKNQSILFDPTRVY